MLEKAHTFNMALNCCHWIVCSLLNQGKLLRTLETKLKWNASSKLILCIKQLYHRKLMLSWITVHALHPVDKLRAATGILCPILCLPNAVNMGDEICSRRTIIQFEIGIQLFIPLWMQGWSTFVYGIATVKYHGWIFYDLTPSTHRYRDRNKKIVLFLI